MDPDPDIARDPHVPPSARRECPPPAWEGRAVLHVDMDAFFASVEQLDHPEWRGRPVIVGGDPGTRGVVSTASYEARAFGVHSAMPAALAARLCPDAVWTHGSFARYHEVSAAVMAILRSHTPHVQAASIDEAYLDATPGTHGADPVELARTIMREVAALGVTCSIGLATSKTVAKIASDMDKPNGLTVVRPGDEAAFLAPLPVGALPGIGPVSAARLTRLGTRTLGDLARLDDDTARAVLGSHGPSTVRRARGIDPRPVREERAAKSVSHEETFAEDLRDAKSVRDEVRRLAERTAARLRRHDMKGRTVTVKVRYADFTTRTAQRTLPRPVDSGEQVTSAAGALLDELWVEGVGVRLLGVGVSGFEEQVAQMELALDPSAATADTDSRRATVEHAVDAVRERFGDAAVGFGPRSRRGRGPFGPQAP